ncbi:hypothetical protein [Evansella halocellulosilytica]|uniref:hypothetical protein n=1 Tax=Evansella halocellulosilytica TaxID=2011013 RepID=UPI000BB8A9C5|nr:hypothetical protein [Evansella halocellulosilytica]
MPQNKKKKPQKGDIFNELSSLTPQQILVIIGLLSNVLNVQGVYVDFDQNVEILLRGSLKNQMNLQHLLDHSLKDMDDQKMREYIELIKKMQK